MPAAGQRHSEQEIRCDNARNPIDGEAEVRGAVSVRVALNRYAAGSVRGVPELPCCVRERAGADEREGMVRVCGLDRIDRGEVDLVVAVFEVGDLVERRPGGEIAGLENEAIVARSAGQDIVSRAAVENIVAGAAVEN